MLAGQIGARGQIRTDTGDALDVVPLHWATRANTPPVGLFHQLDLLESRPLELLRARRCEMVGVPGNAPGLGTHLVRCGI